MSAPSLADGQTEHMRWTISRRSFALRMIVLVCVTPLILSPFPVIALVWGAAPMSALWQWATALPLALFLTWVLGDFGIWTRNRATEWILTNRAIHIRSAFELDTALPLTAIKRINRWPWWSLVLRLRNGTAVKLPLVPTTDDTRRTILNLRDAALMGPT
ncbi:hypothetical protein [uncultured Tateyamaria sp.]|uniref:hypothetical protein n=1 Tax=Tateyamaria sp. 1078 TaxID=3417464 RepID=UPI00262B6E12|nr:hypothetical protein [uncultured Tateyamaria sp.]